MGVSSKNLIRREFIKEFRGKLLQMECNGSACVMFYIDINDLDKVNVGYGRGAGDHILREVFNILSETLKNILQPHTYLLRNIENDEFAIGFRIEILPEWCTISKQENLPPTTRVVSRLSAILSRSISNQKFQYQGYVLPVSVSIGAAIVDLDKHKPETSLAYLSSLFVLAKKASVGARDSGTEQILVFDAKEVMRKRIKSSVIAMLREAIQKDYIDIHLQPIVNIVTNHINGFEALIRVRSANHKGYIDPASFIPHLLDHDIICELGFVVFAKVLEALNYLRLKGHQYKISVNVSARQLQNKDFSSNVLSMLAQYPEISPSMISIEMLESGEITNFDTVENNLKALKLAKIFCYIDDFGTGSASFAYLKKLPVSGLKIDQLFVRNLLSSDKDEAIVKSCISIAKAFSVEIIAEGVESVEVAHKLMELGCELIQGYYICRPSNVEDIDHWICQNISDSRSIKSGSIC